MTKPLLYAPACAVKRWLGGRAQGIVVPTDSLYYWDGALHPCAELSYNPETHRVEMPGGVVLPGDTTLQLFPAGTTLD